MTSSASNPFVNYSRNFSGSILIFRAHLDGNGSRSPRACLCPTDEREFEMRQKILQDIARQNATVGGKKQPYSVAASLVLS